LCAAIGGEICRTNWGRGVEALCPPSEPTPLSLNENARDRKREANFYKVAPSFGRECCQCACASNESPYAPSPMQATIDCCAHIRRCLCDRQRAVSFVCARQCDPYVTTPLMVLGRQRRAWASFSVRATSDGGVSTQQQTICVWLPNPRQNEEYSRTQKILGNQLSRVEPDFGFSRFSRKRRLLRTPVFYLTQPHMWKATVRCLL
jgi:hypothetical protein